MKQDKNINKFDSYENFNIPHNWERKKIKHLFVIGRGRVISQEEVSSEEKYPVFSSQTQNNGCLGYISTFDYNCTQLTWTTDGANAGTVFIREGKHNCTNVCGTLLPRTNTISIPFASFSLNYFCQFYKRPDTNGAKIMNNEMAEITIILPETKKQIKIAKFLTYEEEKTHNLIQKQQQLIELLKEKRQAVISHAVTKGLNPDVPMKDSGVEWLGKIPTHWIVCHLKQLAKIRNGQDYKSIESETGFPVIGSGGQFSYAKNYMYDKPSVLLGRKGTIDKPLYMDSCFWVVDTMFYTEVNKNIIAKYLYYISTTIQFDKYSTNTALPSMTQENLGNYSLCYSLDPDEQQNIVDFIELKTNKIDTLIQKQLQQIELLKERRTALISAAVTGKIDLRDWTPPASSAEASLTTEEATA